MPIDYSCYLFPEYEVKGYSAKTLSDTERVKVIDVLYAKKIGDFQEILYNAILYNDNAVYAELIKFGINELSDFRTDMIGGRVPKNRLSIFAEYERDLFQSFLYEKEDEYIRVMMEHFFSCMKVEKIILFPSDYYESWWEKEDFVSKYCSVRLFDFFVQKTNMVEKVKKWDLIYAIVDQNNPAAMQYALTEKWLSKPKDIDLLFEYIQNRGNINPELVGYVLNIQSQNSKQKKKESFNTLSLDEKPLSVTELKKYGEPKL